MTHVAKKLLTLLQEVEVNQSCLQILSMRGLHAVDVAFTNYRELILKLVGFLESLTIVVEATLRNAIGSSLEQCFYLLLHRLSCLI